MIRLTLNPYKTATEQSCPAYAPTSNTASHDNHEKLNSRVSFAFP